MLGALGKTCRDLDQDRRDGKLTALLAVAASSTARSGLCIMMAPPSCMLQPSMGAAHAQVLVPIPGPSTASPMLTETLSTRSRTGPNGGLVCVSLNRCARRCAAHLCRERHAASACAVQPKIDLKTLQSPDLTI